MQPNNQRIFRRASLLGMLAFSLLAPTAAQAATLPGPVTLDGTYTLVHVDGRAGHPGADGFRQEILAGGHAYDLRLGKGLALRSGDRVRMTGRLAGSTLRVQHASVQAYAPDVPPITGTTRVLVVLTDWTAPDSVSAASAGNIFSADSAWFNQSSYGHLSLSTTVTNWVHVSAPAAGLCSDSSVSDQLANRAVTASGYNGSSFDRVVVYFPSSNDPSCTNVAGFAEAPGSRVWLNGTMDTRSSIHEQGHNYGLYHAHSAACTTQGSSTPVAAPDAAADNCTYSDYGDPFDAMGASGLVAEFSAGQKNVLGWLDAGRRASLTAGGSVSLVPYEEQSAAVHAAVFAAGPTRSYWFENRTASGPDASLPAGATSGVLVHVVDPVVDVASGEASSWAPAQSYLLDQSPADHWLGTAVLPYGQSWTSPEGTTFAVGSPSGGLVSVTADAVAVADAAPGPVPPPAPAVQASSLTLRLASGQQSQQVVEGAAVLVSGKATRPDGSGAGGSPVELQVTPHGRAAWHPVSTQAAAGSGVVSATVRAAATSDYRLHVEASATEQGSDSNVLTVVVKPVVFAAVSRPSIVHGRTVGLNVSIPGHAGQLVVVERWSHNAWHPYASVRLAANGKRSVVVRLATKGHYLYRFAKAADAFHLSALSKALQVRAV